MPRRRLFVVCVVFCGKMVLIRRSFTLQQNLVAKCESGVTDTLTGCKGSLPPLRRRMEFQAPLCPYAIDSNIY